MSPNSQQSGTSSTPRATELHQESSRQYFDNTEEHGGDFQPGTGSGRANYDEEHGGDYEPAQSKQDQRRVQGDNAQGREIKPASYDFPPPHSISNSTRTNQNASSSGAKSFVHRDALRRPFSGVKIYEQYLDPRTRRIIDLEVQRVSRRSPSTLRSDITWKRERIRSGAPLIIRVSEFALENPVMWVPACIALFVLMIIPTPVAASPRNHGKFDPVPYRDWRYPYVTKNAAEQRSKVPSQASEYENILAARDRIRRLTEPEILCFVGLDGISSTKEDVRDYLAREGLPQDSHVPYIVVSYTSSQFPSDPNPEFLHEVGRHAARMAGLNAYWVSSCCLGKTKEERQQNVWRICDVIRYAHSVVVALANKNDPNINGPFHTEVLMKEWSERVWVLPELLLTPEKGEIVVYTRGIGFSNTHSRFKRNFRLSEAGTKLLDFKENSVALTPLEHVVYALEALQHCNTTQYCNGDLSYALMGLLSQRPNVVPKDSSFQAFARLSLANDSNRLLERLVCLLPKTRDESWMSLSDVWDAALWDIEPSTQVCGIGHEDTVIIDGVRGAAIRWKSFTPVLTLGHETTIRRAMRYAVRAVPHVLLLGLFILIAGVVIKGQHNKSNAALANSVNAQDDYEDGSFTTSSTSDSDLGEGSFATSSTDEMSQRVRPLVIGLIVPGSMILGLWCMLLLSMPLLLRKVYCGKVWEAQPWLFGVEGYIEIKDLERLIFGSCHDRLKWTAFGSHLSRHEPDADKRFSDFYEPLDPTSNPKVKSMVDDVQRPNKSEKIFTLVDTSTMTVSLFSAARPPVAVLLCGKEGGMQRALLCSYDWKTGILYKETVLRMESTVWDKMHFMPRVNLGLKRDEICLQSEQHDPGQVSKAA